MMIADSALQRVEETEFTGNARIWHRVSRVIYYESSSAFPIGQLLLRYQGLLSHSLSVRFISVAPTTIPSASGLGWRLACDIRCIQRIWRWWAVVHGNKCLCWMPNVCTTEGFGYVLFVSEIEKASQWDETLLVGTNEMTNLVATRLRAVYFEVAESRGRLQTDHS